MGQQVRLFKKKLWSLDNNDEDEGGGDGDGDGDGDSGGGRVFRMLESRGEDQPTKFRDCQI
jgi:hypothetical protein